MFYTYIYFRQDGTPYYIGKGHNARAFQRYGRYVHTPPRARILVEHWDSEQKALEMEQWYIRLYGRKDNNTGILRNMTDGGDGSTGWIPTEENKANISRSLTGRTLTPEHCRNIGEGTRKAFATMTNEYRIGHAPTHTQSHSEETRRKMSNSREGAKPFAGRTHSEETRRRMSESHKRRKIPV